jgi:transcriptional regulator GlxA family with amidase domain
VKANAQGAYLVPTSTYAAALGPEGKQYDIIVIPGTGTYYRLPRGHISLRRPTDSISQYPKQKEALDFITRQGPKAKHVLAVCVGSHILAATGFLDGKRATTNKMTFREVESFHPKVEAEDVVPLYRADISF